LRKLTFRSGLVLGFALGVGLLLFCRSRVWEIDVVGSTAIDPDLFFEELATCGLHEGMSFHDLNAEEVAFAMQKLDRRIAWMQIRREGVRMIVDWIPTNDSILPLQPPKDRGSNLIASADAVIVDMLIQKGVPTVSIGEVVRKGELLVSGIKQNSAIYAQGRVIGQIKEAVSVTVPIVQTVIRESNTEAIGLEVNLFGHRLCFGESEGSYEESGRLYLFDRIRIPVLWKKIYRCDYDCSERELSEKEAAQLAMRRLSETLEIKLKDGELLSSQVSGGFTDDGYTISADIEYLINIAKTLEFSIENE
jgi:similar to stage IV sporulation protein